MLYNFNTTLGCCGLSNAVNGIGGQAINVFLYCTTAEEAAEFLESCEKQKAYLLPQYNEFPPVYFAFQLPGKDVWILQWSLPFLYGTTYTRNIIEPEKLTYLDDVDCFSITSPKYADLPLSKYQISPYNPEYVNDPVVPIQNFSIRDIDYYKRITSPTYIKPNQYAMVVFNNLSHGETETKLKYTREQFDIVFEHDWFNYVHTSFPPDARRHSLLKTLIFKVKNV